MRWGELKEDYAGNAFYCPEGDYVAWDNETLFPSLWQEIGDLAVGMVLAHEWATGAQAGRDFHSTDWTPVCRRTASQVRGRVRW